MGRGRKKRYSDEQIVRILKEAEAGELQEVLRRHAVSSASYYKWRQKYGDLELQELKRLKALEAENQRLKRLVADQALDIQILKDVNSKKW